MEEEHSGAGAGNGNNWDLHAVVRFGCRRRGLSPPPPTTTRQPADPFQVLAVPQLPLREETLAAPVEKQVGEAGWCFPDLGDGFGQEDADELLKAFCAASPPPPTALPLPLPPPPPQQPQPLMIQPVMAQADVPLQTAAPVRAQPSGRPASGSVPRSKRRKNQQKKVVCHVAADGVSSDVWAWRKYGQKPIKGSPYPRGYYRCSSSKGCAARKQVERSRADPNTFILTFTGEHNHAAPTHRNSLAGTSRHKFPSPSSSSAPAPQPPPPSMVVSAEAHPHAHPSPPSTSPGLSPTTPLRTTSMEEDEEDELLVEDMEMASEDDLLFLTGDSDATTPMSSLFDIDEPFLGSPWAAATSGEAAAAGS